MIQAQKFIETVHKLGTQKYELEKVYRRIQDRELFLVAYGNLYANEGALTPGVNPNDTVEGMSTDRIDKILTKLKEGEYNWQPVRRIEIPKKKGGKRPLGLPTWSDKLLQEVLRMVMEAYYEPQFSEYSHGFRPNRGCHTALSHVYYNWRGVKWFIELDIKGCFDNIDHQILLQTIERNIKDNRLLRLLREMLEAGYMQNWAKHQTYSGTPQGGVLSPLLANIMLNELDRYVENELLPTYNKGDIKSINKEFQKLSNQMTTARRRGNKDLYQALDQQRRKLPGKDPYDPHYRRLKYIRYADDALLGFDGPLSEAEEIKQKIKEFLKTIHLEMSEDKTLITHAHLQKARFLNYEIHIAKRDDQRSGKRNGRTINGTPILTVPTEVVKAWKEKHTKNGKPTHRSELIKYSDYEIVMTYGLEFQGLVNYYTMAHNVASMMYPLKSVMMESLAKTIAAKHKAKTSWVYRKYKRISEEGVNCIVVEVENPKNPEKPYTAKFGHKAIKTNQKTIIEDKALTLYKGRNELVRRLLANECELCGSTENIRVHHTRKLKDIKTRYKGQNEPPQWAVFMMERNRKTIVVCHNCHVEIHAGKYDGSQVK